MLFVIVQRSVDHMQHAACAIFVTNPQLEESKNKPV
jgi:hypothetical protein